MLATSGDLGKKKKSLFNENQNVLDKAITLFILLFWLLGMLFDIQL